jgi:hypothetical protein
VLDPSSERLTEDGDVLASRLERLAHVESQGAFHHRAVAHADAETEPPTAHFLQRRRLLRQQHGVTRIYRKDAGTETDAGRDVRIGREHLKSVAPQAVGDPDTFIARPVGSSREIYGRREIGTGREEDGGAWHRSQRRGATPSAAS